ncbi:hypothetical protein ACPXAU_24325, partial [Salmonella enterica]|uniref:hypothetical protein n=1 Tax=Salmonella enterica TaxID=28901 RepID=UPI003CEA3E53
MVKFAELDGVKPLLGKGWLGFDMRDPTRLVARKPGTVSNRAITDPAAPVAGATGAAAQPVRIEAKQSGPAGEG